MVTNSGNGVDLAVFRTLHRLIARINSEPDLWATLRAVVEGVVEGVGFGVVAVNYRHPDGSFEVVAVAGSAEAGAVLLGTRLPQDAFDAEFAAAEEWGTLRFVPHEQFRAPMGAQWIPPAGSNVPAGGTDAWHPLDALFAPLFAPSGLLVGVLSVDVPAGGRRPGPVARELLEMFAAQAGIAVANARLAAELHLSEESFRLAFDGSGVGMAVVSCTPGQLGRYLRVNSALCRLTGYPAEELLRRSTEDITHPDDVAADRAAVRRGAAGELLVYRTEKRYIRADGSTVWVSLTTSVVGTAAGGHPYAISQVEDISARRAAEETLRHRAAHDPLTGLATRVALEEQLSAVLGRSRRSGRPGAVLFCDLDGFKEVNDHHGHAAGDAALVEIARRLAGQVRAGDTVARYGGDEFVILAEDISAAAVIALAQRLTGAVRRPLALTDPSPRVSVSIGIATIDADSPDGDGLLRAADAAMYTAKAAGGNRHAFAR